MNLFNKETVFCQMSIYKPLALTLLRALSVFVAMETWRELFYLSFAGLL